MACRGLRARFFIYAQPHSATIAQWKGEAARKISIIKKRASQKSKLIKDTLALSEKFAAIFYSEHCSCVSQTQLSNPWIKFLCLRIKI